MWKKIKRWCFEKIWAQAQDNPEFVERMFKKFPPHGQEEFLEFAQEKNREKEEYTEQLKALLNIIQKLLPKTRKNENRKTEME